MPTNELSEPDAKASILWSCLEPYAQLAQLLLPRMSGLTVLNAQGDILWSNELMAISETSRQLISRALAEANSHPSLPGELVDPGDGDLLYVFWLRQDAATDAAAGTAAGAVFASVNIRCRIEKPSDRRPFSTINSLVRPAIDCLRREVMARREITELQFSLAEHDGDLDMLLTVAGKGGRDLEENGDDLKSIVANAAAHIDVGLAVLIVPEKNLVLVQPAGKEPLNGSLVARSHRHLMATAQKRREAVIENSIRLQAADDAPPYRILSCPVARNDGNPIGVLAMFRSSTQPEFNSRHVRLIELIARRIGTVITGNYDPITGLLTRAPFERRVRQTLESGAARPASLSAVYLDVNRLQWINDTHGMLAGDRVLASVGELLRQRVPHGGVAGRISGDRCALLLPADMATAVTFAESLRAGVEQLTLLIGDATLPVSVSIGVAAIDATRGDYADAFAPAESACKLANDHGRNRVEVFEGADQNVLRRYRDLNIISELRAAIRQDRLRLFAQPLAPVGDTQRAQHFEILLRLVNERGETVGPDTFLSAAQRHQLMPELDRAVILKALTLLRPHAERLRNDSLVFSINFSGQSLQDAGFAEFIATSIAASGLSPTSLAFELAESAAVNDMARADPLIRSLRELGCGVALDDFGTGLSSLSYLRSLPVSALKIDGSFVRDVLTDSKAESMIEAVAYLARSMNLVTVAEYVETQQIRDRLATLGVDYVQGYAVGRPAPLAAVLEQLGLHSTFASFDGVNTGKLAMAV